MILMASLTAGCGNTTSFEMPFLNYKEENTKGLITFSKEDARVDAFSKDLCVFSDDVNKINKEIDNINAGLLIDVNNQSALYALNAFTRKYPASTTKILTAYVTLKYCGLNDIIECTDEVSQMPFDDAVVLGLKKGDRLTVDQALHLMLLSSYNDVAKALAIHISGSESAFADLCNEEALLLGASNTHFTNSNGLPDSDHVTSAYDLYLMFNAALEYPVFEEIIQTESYETIYHDTKGNDIPARSTNSNAFLRGTYSAPDGVTVIGGKTGTTSDAGYCLVVLVKDRFSNPYIAIILGAESREDLYTKMSELLSELSN